MIVNSIETNNPIPFDSTTCGSDAYARGSGQKIVGFSFFGDIELEEGIKKRYFAGIADNLRLMSVYYPGWVMRLYFDLDKKDPVMKMICGLACNNNNLDLCDAASLPGTPMKNASKVFARSWRFFPALDPQVI
jgi:hypothetical protein